MEEEMDEGRKGGMGREKSTKEREGNRFLVLQAVVLKGSGVANKPKKQPGILSFTAEKMRPRQNRSSWGGP